MKIKTVINRFDLLIHTIILMICTVFIVQLDFSNANFFVLATFFINGIWFLANCFSLKVNVSIKKTVYIFMLFFMFLAPLQQYCSGVVLWANQGLILDYSNRDYIYANICILLFCVLLELGYARRKKRVTAKEKNRAYLYEMRSNNALSILHIFCFLTVAYLIATDGMTKNIGFLAGTMIRHQLRNMLILAPVEAFLISQCLAKNNAEGKYAKASCYVFGAESLVVLLLFSGDLSRFLFLGALMMMITYFLLNKKKIKSLYFLIYFIGFFVSFSAIRGKGFLSTDIIKMANFNHVDFDAYQIFLGVIKYVSSYGMVWCKNIISAAMFIVPRSIVPWKLEGTGGIVVSTFGSWFTNVSCPLPAEFYFALGLPGILIGAFLMGMLVKKLDGMSKSDNQLSVVLFCIISGMTVYVMRGALLATLSYLLGILLGFWGMTRICFIRIKK